MRLKYRLGPSGTPVRGEGDPLEYPTPSGELG
jgi:hypothetical protein